MWLALLPIVMPVIGLILVCIFGDVIAALIYLVFGWWMVGLFTFGVLYIPRRGGVSAWMAKADQ